ncbi:hypothetical protein [Subtercola boreus]|uniref:hypothetical protein n=1 Tax=Subtercola boreus TaxID=120213 RepID=UPI001B85BBE5|nr:hypothetical protein [Subtercola boreus]
MNEQAANRTAARHEVVDIADQNLPLLDEAIPALVGSTMSHRHLPVEKQVLGFCWELRSPDTVKAPWIRVFTGIQGAF